MRRPSLAVLAAFSLTAAASLGCNRDIVDEPAVASAATGIPRGAPAAEGVQFKPVAMTVTTLDSDDPLGGPSTHPPPKAPHADPFGPETIPDPDDGTDDPLPQHPHHGPKKKGTQL